MATSGRQSGFGLRQRVKLTKRNANGKRIKCWTECFGKFPPASARCGCWRNHVVEAQLQLSGFGLTRLRKDHVFKSSILGGVRKPLVLIAV